MTLLEFGFDNAFGLPAHPLVVHAAVVLVPLAALAFVATGWRAAWRQAYYLPITLLAVAGSVASWVAKQTGESLQETVRAAGKRVGDHPQHGDIAFVTATLFALACVAVYVYQTYGEQLRERFGLQEKFRLPVDEQVALYVATVPFAALAVVAMVIAGHSGATLVWSTNK
jgi:uncharacterized membrane protein